MALTDTPECDAILHLGTGKTGTTSIQHFMRSNRPKLLERGVLYPRSPGGGRHTKFGLSFRSVEEFELMPAWHQMRAQSPERFRRRFHRRLAEEIRDARPERVLFSDEALYGLPDEALARLREFTDSLGGQLRLIVYLRRQDDHLISFYQQQVKVGETRRLVGWLRGGLDFTYDYGRRLETLERALEPASFVVRRFERGGFRHGGLEADFLDAADIDGDGFDTVDSKNETMDAATVEFLRLYNLHMVEDEGAKVGVMDHRALVRRLAQRRSGPALTLPEEALDRFMGKWEDSNRAVAAKYLGEPELFRAPRRREHVTDRQVLEPADVEDFLEIAELPEDARERVRRIAEREAAGR